MGFFNGRASFLRFRVDGPAPRMFSEEHLAMLAENAAGRQRMIAADGVEVGWTGGDHILDLQFDMAKNIINDMLFFNLRTDVMKLPGDLMRAYYAIDLAALAKNNPSGHASALNKREAKESARDRLELEAKDGRYTKKKTVEVVWDLKTNELLFGTTSAAMIDRLLVLFKNTFGFAFESISAGKRAYALAEGHQRTRSVDDASPSPFVPSLSPSDVAWIPDEASRDFVGNDQTARQFRGRGVHGPDAFPGVPARRLRTGNDHARRADPVARGAAGDPVGQVAAQGRPDHRPARCPI